jgi:MFS superfamily sulfate permease-like transporter
MAMASAPSQAAKASSAEPLATAATPAAAAALIAASPTVISGAVSIISIRLISIIRPVSIRAIPIITVTIRAVTIIAVRRKTQAETVIRTTSTVNSYLPIRMSIESATLDNTGKSNYGQRR